jgi:hypothetical protein
MNIQNQVSQGLLVSPKTKQILQFNTDKTKLLTKDIIEEFDVTPAGVPIFLQNKDTQEKFSNSSMDAEYANVPKPASSYKKIKDYIYGNLYSRDHDETKKIFDNYTEENLLLSIGGGPIRDHKLMTHINISNYHNVDVVADAHSLPYADNSVDAIYIAEVIEHLYHPLLAIQEMHRVLKPGGKVMSVTPFMQPYHGYPHHYQNLTITGHEYYFTSSGFKLIKSGISMGPTLAVIIILSKYIFNYFPPILNKILGGGFLLFAMIFIRPIDRLIIEKRPNAHILASETFVLVEKA